MRHYCTLFDKNYLAKGLVMLDSLQRHASQPYIMHILAMDHETADVLDQLGYADGLDTVYTVETFRSFPYFSPRPWTEFCWTLASQLTEYLLSRSNFASLTYLDADLMFFANPEPVFAEIGDKSIGVVEHRLIPAKKHLAVNGRFNVAFNYFKNNPTGRDCLATWAAQVRERCDTTTCGDQKFLDEWPARYGDECHVIRNIGADTAPWNLANWNVTAGPCVDGQRIIFHHYHEFRERDDGSFRLTNYDLRPEDIEFIYRPYVDNYQRAQQQINRCRGNVAV